MIGLCTNSSSVHTWYRANNGLALWRSPIRAGQRVFLDEGYKWSPVQPTCGILKRGGKLNKYSKEKFAKQIVQNQNKLKQDLFHNKEKFAQKNWKKKKTPKQKLWEHDLFTTVGVPDAGWDVLVVGVAGQLVQQLNHLMTIIVSIARTFSSRI